MNNFLWHVNNLRRGDSMSFSFKLNLKEYLKIILLQLILTLLLYKPISNSLFAFIIMFYKFIPGNLIFLSTIVALILLYIPICVIHELLHALAHKILGGKPRIGFRGIYAYTLETSGKELTRTELLIVLLMPVTVISLICVILPWNVFKLAYYLNLLGSCGDIYMSLWLSRVDKNMKIIDRNYGFDVK